MQAAAEFKWPSIPATKYSPLTLLYNEDKDKEAIETPLQGSVYKGPLEHEDGAACGGRAGHFSRQHWHWPGTH